MNKRRFIDIFCTALQCFLFLWCVIGLWACAHKILELEERVDCIQTLTGAVESPENKLILMAMRCQKMEQDNDQLRLRIEELEDQIDDALHSIKDIAPAEEPPCSNYYEAVSAEDDLIEVPKE